MYVYIYIYIKYVSIGGVQILQGLWSEGLHEVRRQTGAYYNMI